MRWSCSPWPVPSSGAGRSQHSSAWAATRPLRAQQHLAPWSRRCSKPGTRDASVCERGGHWLVSGRAPPAQLPSECPGHARKEPRPCCCAARCARCAGAGGGACTKELRAARRTPAACGPRCSSGRQSFQVPPPQAAALRGRLPRSWQHPPTPPRPGAPWPVAGRGGDPAGVQTPAPTFHFGEGQHRTVAGAERSHPGRMLLHGEPSARGSRERLHPGAGRAPRVPAASTLQALPAASAAAPLPSLRSLRPPRPRGAHLPGPPLRSAAAPGAHASRRGCRELPRHGQVRAPRPPGAPAPPPPTAQPASPCSPAPGSWVSPAGSGALEGNPENLTSGLHRFSWRAAASLCSWFAGRGRKRNAPQARITFRGDIFILF